ncbi:MAG: prephenate dehydratase domain-containing protein [Eubacteriales bacterium]
MDARQVIDTNIAALSREYNSFCERRLAHIRERAVYIHGITGDIHDRDLPAWIEAIRTLYRDIVYDDIKEEAGNVCEPNRRGVSTMRSVLYISDRICLCRALMDTASRRLTAEDFLSADSITKMPNRIAYLRNAYTDAAYSRFSAVLRDPTVTYCEDFAAVCEDVYYGRASLCIIPIENSSEGRLSTFRNLINKYELKIVLTCLVTTSESGTETRFALLKKNIEKITLLGQPKKTDLFEFSVIISDTEPQTAGLSDILTAARCFGLTLYKVDSAPVSYSDTEYAQDLVFCTDGSELNSFICYLSLEAPQFMTIGIYPHLL